MINIKEAIKMIKNGDMVNLSGKMEIFIKEIMKEMYVVDMVRCTGKMEVITRANG